jgi:hypothetical protein
VFLNRARKSMAQLLCESQLHGFLKCLCDVIGISFIRARMLIVDTRPVYGVVGEPRPVSKSKYEAFEQRRAALMERIGAFSFTGRI